ncbi:MAG: LysM peptidoglycan-binding domain-containing protein [Polyangiales bacterium]
MRARVLALAMLQVALCLARPSPAQAQNADVRVRGRATLENYTVVEGDSCRSIARARFGSSRRIDLIHAHNSLGPAPHHLRPGQTLRLPSAALAGAEAGVARVVRDVDLQRSGSPLWSGARVGAALHRGDRVTTGERSASELIFRGGGVLQMRSQSLVVLTGAGRPSPRRIVRATLERGALRGRLGELTGRAAVTTTVTTPSATARLGADALVAVDGEGVSRIASLEGTTLVDGVRVPEGTGTQVQPGGRPSRPRPLPRPPSWRTDDDGRFMGLAHSGAILRGRWNPVSGASAYRVEVARRPDGTELVAAVEVPGDATEFSVPRIPVGTYYVSVATIDGAFFEGRPSPRRAMVVLEARIVPPGGGEPPSDRLDPGDPSRAYTPPTALPGTWLVSPAGYRCGDGEELASLLTLRTLGHHVVRCVDARERVVSGFDVIIVEARVRPERPFLRRGTRRVARLLVRSPLALPERMIARAPSSVSVGSVRLSRTPAAEEGVVVYEVEIGVGLDAPDTLSIVLEVAAGSERIRVGDVSFAVRDARPRGSRR